jgi:SPP1 gp7 family putative phage head morphogenesis protein
MMPESIRPIRTLTPIKESSEDYDEIEARISEVLREHFYVPLMRLLGPAKTLTNSKSYLLDAIRYGRIEFYRGSFRGSFSARVSKELRALGARWDGPTGTFKLSQASLSPEILAAIQASNFHFQQKIESIDKRLSEIFPEEIAARIKIDHLFDRALWKVEKNFAQSVKGIAVAPKLSREARATIARDYEQNMKLYIQDWTKKEIVDLRKRMQATVFAGNRYESAVKTIQKSYDVSLNKAKFLARQETGLLMAKFKEVRYKEAGVKRYIWKCVAGTSAHPVRPSHKILDGKIFSWDNPVELDKRGLVKPGGLHKPGDNKNPGEDYNCRCYAKPIVEF